MGTLYIYILQGRVRINKSLEMLLVGAHEKSSFLCDHKCASACKGNKACGLQCDSQSCDPCHPNNAGYTVLAATVMQGLGL
jgi:hypothetical protein